MFKRVSPVVNFTKCALTSPPQTRTVPFPVPCVQYGMICAKRCFDTTDVNHNQSLDFLEFIHFIYELCPQIDLVPQKALMIFIREVGFAFCGTRC